MSRTPNADLSELSVFAEVVRLGSFTAAARSLGLPKSTVSRKVSELEARIGARLLQRTTRSVSTTDVGERYAEHARRILAELEAAAAVVATMQAEPSGPLRVSVPVGLGVLGPVFAEFLARHPRVSLEVVALERRVDLVGERFDLALRAGALGDSSLVAKRIGAVRRSVLAAPALAARLGPLSGPAALADVPACVFAPDGTRWTLVRRGKEHEVVVHGRFVTNDYELLRAAARAEHGVALLPEYLCLEDVAEGRLVPVLPGYCGRETPVHAVYPSGRHRSPKVDALVALLRERLSLTLPSTRA